MTADEGRRSPPDDDPPPSTPPDREASEPTASTADRSDPSDPPVEPGDGGRRTDGEPFDESDETNPAVAGRSNAGDGPSAPSRVPGRERSESVFHRLWTAESGPLFFLRELLTSAGAVLLVGLVLFGVSGVWPPMVAVESGSMEPHMHKGDLVFITEPGRYTPDVAYGSTGVVTAETGADVGYRTFGGDGSVIVYDEPGQRGPPIIHRAEFYVEEGENWYDRTEPQFVSADDCSELLNCPAPHGGFITKGDANSRYDQASGIAAPVRPSWITGVARVRIPYLGWVRLGLADLTRTRGVGLFVGDATPPGAAPELGLVVTTEPSIPTSDVVTLAGVRSAPVDEEAGIDAVSDHTRSEEREGGSPGVDGTPRNVGTMRSVG
jgi:signal peptidase